jgi:hypothetical protein
MSSRSSSGKPSGHEIENKLVGDFKDAFHHRLRQERAGNLDSLEMLAKMVPFWKNEFETNLAGTDVDRRLAFMEALFVLLVHQSDQAVLDVLEGKVRSEPHIHFTQYISMHMREPKEMLAALAAMKRGENVEGSRWTKEYIIGKCDSIVEALQQAGCQP